MPSLLLETYRNFRLLGNSTSQAHGRKMKLKQLTKIKRISLEIVLQHSLRGESNKMNKQKNITQQGNWLLICIHFLIPVYILKVMVAEYPVVLLVTKAKIVPQRNTSLEQMKCRFQTMEQEETEVDCRQ